MSEAPVPRNPGKDDDLPGMPAGPGDRPSLGSPDWQLMPQSPDWPEWMDDEAHAEDEDPAELPEVWHEFTARELGAVLGVSAGDAEEMLSLARDLEVYLPGTKAAFRTGIVNHDGRGPGRRPAGNGLGQAAAQGRPGRDHGPAPGPSFMSGMDHALRQAIWAEIAVYPHGKTGRPARVLDADAGQCEFTNTVPAA